MKNNILIIGGAGYIGSHVAYELNDNEYQTTILDDLSTGKKENIDSRSKFIQGSFFDQKLLNSILKNIDTVIHLAALKNAGESMEKPSIYTKHNIVQTLKLIDTCVENHISNFIFSSSAAVYGNPKYLPIDERHITKPINYYGYTKLCVEKNLRWYNTMLNLNIVCLRYFNASGYDINKRICGKESNPANLLPIIMEVANRTRSKIEIYGNDYDTSDGTCLRDYIHVNDLASAHVKSIKALDESNKIVLNLATGDKYSVLDVIKRTELITKQKIPYDIVERREGDPAILYAKSNKAFKVLNWSPKYSDLDTIISSMWEVYKK